jgi:hypothetical protein
MKMFGGFIFTVAAASFAYEANASDLTVCRAGCQHATIQSAIDSSQPGDVIHIAAGTYFENLLVPNKRLTFLGAGQDQTAIDGLHRGSVLTLGTPTGGTPQTVSIIGVTITHGRATNGGGIQVNNVALDLQNSIVSSNVAANNGGGIDVGAFTVPAKITRSMIVHNGAGNLGGGVAVEAECVAQIVDSNIDRNTAAVRGGGLHGEGASHTSIQGTTIANNTSRQDGGGLYIEEGEPHATLTFTTGSLVGNVAKRAGGGLFDAGGRSALSSAVVARNNAGTDGGGIHGDGSGLKDSFVVQNTAGGRGGGIFGTNAPAGNTIADNVPSDVAP